MSELITRTHADGRWQLRASVSALALAALFPAPVSAADENRPTVWIELGAQLERLTNGQESYSPPFVTSHPENPFTPPGEAQRPPRYSNGEEGRISFSPNESDWTFSAAIRYGRSNRSNTAHEETNPPSPQVIRSIPALGVYETGHTKAVSKRFETTAARTQDAHLILDFIAGKDVGLGAFGSHGSSMFGAGVRFAQFTSQSRAKIDSNPDFTISYKYITNIGGLPGLLKLPIQNKWDLYAGEMQAERSFSGIGPKLEWDANTTLLGRPETGAVTFDWGLNGTLLFGRQKMHAHHETTAHYWPGDSTNNLPTLYPAKAHNTARSKSIIVPNVGGFAGLSLRFQNAKVSLGYRVDAFFGAMDGGIDTRKTYDRDFYGPFATISIGLGG